jgi:hypothetical protein
MPGAEGGDRPEKTLEDAEQKAKDAASDLQVVVEGEPPRLPYTDP